MHSINRNNYEDWLMLYLDNELTATERHAVEAFVADHPDVQDELEGLKETMLIPFTPPAMPGSERLLMPETWNEEALTRQQVQLLMLADGELPVNEKNRLESEMAKNPLLQKEWALVKHTILACEAPAEMPNKEKLYRKSEPSKVIPIGRILRFAVAASIIGFGWLFVNQRQQNIQKGIDEVAVTAPTIVDKDNNSVTVGITDKVPAQTGIDNSVASTLVSDTHAVKKGGSSLIQTTTAPTALKKQNALYVTTVKEPAAPVENKIRDVAVQMPLISTVGFEDANIDEIPVIEQPTKITGDDIAITIPVEKIPVAYEIIDPDEWEENETISIAGARIPKQKIRNAYRNFTRPIARSFERNNVTRIDVK